MLRKNEKQRVRHINREPETETETETEIETATERE